MPCLCVKINVQTGGGTGYFTDVRRVEPLLQLYTAAGHAAGFGTKSESLSAHMRGVISGNQVETVQEC